MKFWSKAAICMLVVVISQNVRAQKVHKIRLYHKKEKTVVSQFRIEDIVDDREDTTSLGDVLPGLRLRKMPVNLENGAVSAFRSYIAKYVAVEEGAVPMTMHIKKLKVVEDQGMTIERVTVAYSYAFYKDGSQLLQYDGESFAQTSMDASGYIGRLVSESIDQTLKKVDESLKNSTSQSSLEVTARILPGSQTSGNIPYSRSRPLTFDDFRGKVDDLSLAAAATYSGISVGYNTISDAGRIKLAVDIVPAVSSDRSWIRPAAKNKKILAHEQRHFDITALHACLLAEKIRQAALTPANFKEELERLQAESSTLLQQVQDQYDEETSHGSIAAKQLSWDKNIEAQLQALSCY